MPRILAVDDSQEQLLALELHLRAAGFEVETAIDGLQALRRCEEAEFDLILLDVRMPGIDGFEVSKRLQLGHRAALTPVIFLSGHLPSESARRDAFAMGPVDFVQKPFDRDELLARINLMLRLQEVRRRLVVENTRLGRELDTALTALAEARASVGELKGLMAEAPAVQCGIVVVGPERTVVGVDATARQLWPGVAAGSRLEALGDSGAAVAALLRGGDGDGGVVAVGDVRCEALPLGGGFTALHLWDDARLEFVRERARGREAAIPVAAASAPSAPSAPAVFRIAGLVGDSDGVRAVAAMVDRLRRQRATVLIHGETGTGKEVVARALHYEGPKPNSPFIPIHCGAITRDLIESELFGFEKGAFTGAQQRHEGLFGAADGGTIFLDEIAETSLELQVKLLRVLQFGEIRPVGATARRFVDVRIVAATNRDLRELVEQGRFREDLYHRLGVVTIDLPPLRDRRDDLESLVAHFVARCNERYHRGDRPVHGVSRAAMRRLLDYDWPGNVRELENVVERAFALGVGELIHEEDLPPLLRQPQPARTVVLPAMPPAETRSLRAHRRQAERAAFERALAEARGDKLAAARVLGLPRSTFYRRLRDLGF